MRCGPFFFIVSLTEALMCIWLGIQDAILAAEAGVDGILLSNHGGRYHLTESLPCLTIFPEYQVVNWTSMSGVCALH